MRRIRLIHRSLARMPENLASLNPTQTLRDCEEPLQTETNPLILSA